MLLCIWVYFLSLIFFAKNCLANGERSNKIRSCDLSKICTNGWRKVRTITEANNKKFTNYISFLNTLDKRLIIFEWRRRVVIQDSNNSSEMSFENESGIAQDMVVRDEYIYILHFDPPEIRQYSLNGKMVNKIDLISDVDVYVNYYNIFFNIQKNKFYLSGEKKIEELNLEGTLKSTFLEKDQILQDKNEELYEMNWTSDGNAFVSTSNSIIKISQNKTVIGKTNFDRHKRIAGRIEIDYLDNIIYGMQTINNGSVDYEIKVANSNLTTLCSIPTTPYFPTSFSIMKNCSIAMGAYMYYYNSSGLQIQVQMYEINHDSTTITSTPSTAKPTETRTTTTTTTNPTTQSPTDGCQPGWYKNGKNCYLLNEKTTGWFDAELKCQEEEGHVVSISTKQEDAFLQALGLCRSQFWTGMILKKSREWKDVSAWQWWDGAKNEYTKLHNDITRPSAVYENCVYHTQNSTWETDNCRNERSFVCKRPTSKESSYKVNNNSRCQQGWQKFGNSCYFLSSNDTNYFHAQLACHDMGASVITIHSKEEHTFLQIMQGCNNEVWIGLERSKPCISTNTSMCWEWVDLNDVTYSDWMKNQPDQDQSKECVVNDGGWKSVHCTLKKKYVCKKLK